MKIYPCIVHIKMKDMAQNKRYGSMDLLLKLLLELLLVLLLLLLYVIGLLCNYSAGAKPTHT